MRRAFTDRKGITLVELLVVIAIVSILALALAFSYNGWIGRYKGENATKQLYTDMLYAKNRAIETSRDYFINFPTATAQSTSYTIYEDTYTTPAGNGQLNTGAGQDRAVTGYPKTLDYSLSGYRDSIDYSTTPATVTVSPAIALNNTNVSITFDKNGIMTSSALFPDGAYNGVSYKGVIRFTSSNNADYDCILISKTSLDMGKWGNCNANDTNDCCIK